MRSRFSQFPMTLPDAAARAEFIEALEANISLLAPAGVGKTQAIVQRIAAIAKHPNAREWLPRLVVVTFTRRAANEIRQRARAAILTESLSDEVQIAFGRAFFGTIHSFCLSLLQEFGPRIGVAAPPQAVDSSSPQMDGLWQEFFQNSDAIAAAAESLQALGVAQHVSLLDVLSLARYATVGGAAEQSSMLRLEPWNLAVFNAAAILEYPTPAGRSGPTIDRSKASLKAWLACVHQREALCPLPICYSQAKEFKTLWQQTFESLLQWRASKAGQAALAIARAGMQFRQERLQFSYDDQIAAALQLVAHPEAGQLIRSRGYRVILDEAQDTDPLQFELLWEVARSSQVQQLWRDAATDPPAPGRFCMVGDWQQSIYRQRADLATYRRYHDAVVASPGGRALQYAVTFRCAQAVVDWVSVAGPRFLSGEEGQVAFEPFTALAAAPAGKVERWKAPPAPVELSKLPSKARTARAALWEAQAIAHHVREQGLEGLHARHWSQVAILCPRKSWFGPLALAFEAQGIKTQRYSTDEEQWQNPAYAWLSALLTVIDDPADAFEWIGVLREIYGVPDDLLATWAQERFKSGERPLENFLCAVAENSARHPSFELLSAALRSLRQAREACLRLPVSDAIGALLHQTRLRDRLAAIAHPPHLHQEEVLSQLEWRAREAQAEGLSLSAFGQRLRTEFFNDQPQMPEARDAVVLITCQKAKGLEWDAVVVPYFFRRIQHLKPRYPAWHRTDGRLRVLLDAQDGAEAQEARRREEVQEFARLGYVTFTRARQTLILCDDRELFAEGKRRTDQLSLASACRLEEGPCETWDSLPEVALRAPAVSEIASLPPVSAASPASDKNAAVLEQLVAARQIAALALKRTTPHALATGIVRAQEEAYSAEARADDSEETEIIALESIPVPQEEESAANVEAIAYGLWWHSLMERLCWNAPESWDRYFERELPRSPQIDRAQAEWNLWKKSELAARLCTSSLVFHVEAPVLWKQSGNSCIEGIIDLAVWNAQTDAWSIIDWKTNALAPGQSPQTLVDAYAPQIRAYVSALRAIRGTAVEGGLYVTAVGAWCPIATE